jgi:hypothetical protein
MAQVLWNIIWRFLKKLKVEPDMVVHTCNLNYSACRSPKEHSPRPTWEKCKTLPEK